MKNNVSVWFLYIIRTAKQSLYTGITTDVARRLQQHKNGKGAKHLKGHKDLSIVYQINVGERSTALKIEYRIKQLSKQKKERLVLQQPDLEQLLLLIAL
ncbi:GIY-YIG nuclease family protein [Gilliamella mensalis]|uniref:GIY-YIG nuclease family protein n=1 Tax=Gilliamella mensalis TaxID=1908520 RepID=UPI000A151922|nr:GIY-YIG nuclease family protein [Gilliamella mensalis]